MKRFHYLVLFLALSGAFLSGYYFSQRMVGRNEGDAGRRILYYVDPMNPSHTSDKPGVAPCGMNFEPVYADDSAGGRASGSQSLSMSPGAVKISPAKQQIIGVQLGQSNIVSESHTIRTLGRVAADDNRIYRILAPTEGYMGDFPTDVLAGCMVQKDQLLASYFSTEPLAAQQTYLLALRTADRRKIDPAFEEQTGLRGESIDAQVRQAEENLKLVGMGETQIREIARTRQVIKSIEQRAPTAGLVVSRNIFPYSRFERNTEFFRIVDLTRVWILADVYENEEKHIKPGTLARVSLPGRDEVFEAKVSDAVPQFDENSRTYKVRLELDNPGMILRPNVFVDVELAVVLPPSLTVPTGAVLDVGVRKTVFADLGNGYFEPRTVKTGWKFGDRVEIVEGLMPEERIVVSGNFLIDSESRMKLAAAGLYGTPCKDPVCGRDVDGDRAKAAQLITEHEGETYYFCSRECQMQFDDEISFSEGEKPSGSEIGNLVTDDKTKAKVRGLAKDPICGMFIFISKSKAEGLATEYDGKIFYFHNKETKKLFEQAPAHYAKRAAQRRTAHGGPNSRTQQPSPAITAKDGAMSPESPQPVPSGQKAQQAPMTPNAERWSPAPEAKHSAMGHVHEAHVGPTGSEGHHAPPDMDSEHDGHGDEGERP